MTLKFLNNHENRMKQIFDEHDNRIKQIFEKNNAKMAEWEVIGKIRFAA